MMDTSAFVHALSAQPAYRGQIVHIEHIPSREAEYAPLEQPLEKSLRPYLEEHKLLPLYTHQAEAINYARQGMNVMVATSSASGKTLCYNIPVMESLLTERDSCGLYCPTISRGQGCCAI
jgi:DEAD/DEAH box helicase domain-containing protein